MGSELPLAFAKSKLRLPNFLVAHGFKDQLDNEDLGAVRNRGGEKRRRDDDAQDSAGDGPFGFNTVGQIWGQTRPTLVKVG